MPLFKTPLLSTGCILFTRPDRLRWEITAPFHSLLVVAGDSVGKFEFTDGERKALALGRTADVILLVMEQIRTWFQGRFDRTGKVYRVRSSKVPRPLIVLEPVQTGLSKNLRSIELWLSADLASLRELRILEAQGSTTTLRFAAQRQDLELAADWFATQNPGAIDYRVLFDSPAPKPPVPRDDQG
jgi:outer membrane lipoprotein-sorting protein